MPDSGSTPPTFEDLLADAATEPAQIARRLRKRIMDVHPDTVEVIYLGYKSASYGIGAKKNSEAYCYIMPQKAQVNLGFYYGVGLDDPEGLLEGTGKKLRHVKIHSTEDVDKPAIHQLIQASYQERKTTLNR